MSSDVPGEPRIVGTLHAASGTGIARVEARLDTDIDDAWSAMTEPERVARWYGEVTGEIRLGGAFRLYVASNDVETEGRIDICEPSRRLLFVTRETDESWRKGQGIAPFDATVDATLTADGDRTVLVLEVRGIPLEPLAFFGVGWHIHVESLAAFLAGSQPLDTDARWDELVPAYLDLAAQI